MTDHRLTAVPAHIETNPRLGTWLDVTEGRVDVQVGKVELGQGILTALHQIAADALALPLDLVRVRAAHTGGPDQGVTAGSLSVLQSAPALRYLGAAVRQLGEAPDEPTPAETSAYVDRISALDPLTDLTGFAVVAQPGPTRAVGTDVPRVDLPDKVLGRPRFLTDLRPDGLLHGRVLRPPSPSASLARLPDDWTASGVVLVRDGSFLGLVGEREDDVDRALAELAAAAAWDESDTLPDEHALAQWLRDVDSEPTHGAGRGSRRAHPHRVVLQALPGARVHRPELCDGDVGRQRACRCGATARASTLSATRSPRLCPCDRSLVRVKHVENAGCYGHNAADDAAFDAVLLARAVPGPPVLLRWSRPDELAWGPLSSAMTADVVGRARRRAGIDGWSYDVWSQGHTRPARVRRPARPARRRHAGAAGGVPGRRSTRPRGNGAGSTRNALPVYDLRTASRHRAPADRRRRCAARRCARSAPTSTSSRSSRSWTRLAAVAGARPAGVPAGAPVRRARPAGARARRGAAGWGRAAARRQRPGPRLRPLQGHRRLVRGGGRGRGRRPRSGSAG